MATIYPAQIDNIQSLPLVIDGQTPINGAPINRLRDAILAIEQTLGVNPANTFGTVSARLDYLSSIAGGGTNFVAAQDLSGNALSQTVIGLQGRPISPVGPSFGQAIAWDGLAWVPTTINSFTAAHDLSGTFTTQTVIGLQGRPVSSAAPSVGQAIAWNGSTWAPSTIAGFAAGNDLSGTATNQTVIGLQGRSVSSSAPSNNQALLWSGSNWSPTNILTTDVSSVLKSISSVYNILPQDDLLLVNTTGGSATVNLPGSPTASEKHRIKDATGNAATNNITINGSGNNIDGSSSYVLAMNYGLLEIIFNGTQWNII